MQSEATDDLIVEEALADLSKDGRAWPRWRIAALALSGLFLLALVVAWLSRERIADNLIASELEKRGIPATYRLESIGPREQVLTNLVVGDPQRPDFTAERLIVSVRPRFGVPDIGALTVVRPRLYGKFADGKLSFGALDPLIFTDSKEPFRLPAMVLAIKDGRGLIESEYGAVGVKVAGQGNLRGGFSGELAAVAPDLAYGDCEAARFTAYGHLSVSGERPRFKGPVRLAGLACPGNGVQLAHAAIAVELKANQALNRITGRLFSRASRLAWKDYRIAGAGGTIDLDWRPDRLLGRYDLAGRTVDTPQARVPRIRLAGQLRAVDGFSKADLRGGITGSIARPGTPLLATLERLAQDSEGTFVAHLVRKVGVALRREANDATFAADLIARRRPEGDSLTVPEAVLRGASGQALASLSRLQVRMGEGGPQVLGGSFRTGGPGLPRISGSIRHSGSGAFAADISLAEYAAGDARLAVPRLAIVQRGERLGFAGNLRMSGAIPGGHATDLAVPLVGDWSQGAGLTIGRSCAMVRFDRLRLSGLELARRSLALCPPRGGAIVRAGPQGLRIAAGAPALDLSGRLGGTPVRLASGPVGLAWPGNLSARAIDVALGPARNASRFRIGHLSARIGSDVAGTFDNATVALNGVPLDLSEASGRWRYAGGVLSLSDGTLRVSDREEVDRFQPLVASGATLRLENNRIAASALLRKPKSQREVMLAEIAHDLGSGTGHADLIVEGLLFDNAVQPDTLTPLALGVIANVEGTVLGTGRIDWNETGVTSSGRFATEGLDFAAAFGPVRGASGTIQFTDLLNLVTAPDQTLRFAAINPGIEVNDGLATFELRPGRVLAMKGARWPFLDGTLTLLPVDIPIGSSEPVRYVLAIEGIDAARFVQRIELTNLSATGVFDGQVPLVFDKDGGRIEAGYLKSRPPGGNISYVGELTYKDLSAMGNFVFDALRSIDYRQMAIQLDGPLAGEIITRVAFDGISQGEGASSNFLTRRIAALPIQFRLNIRAPFMQLVSSTRSLYDPEYIRDPRMMGILDNTASPAPPSAGAGVQPSVSGGKP
jgi:hypothetical protein